MTDDQDADALRRSLLALIPALAFAKSAGAQDASVVQPDSYRVVLDNDKLHVLEFLSRPGMGLCGTGMHSHPPHLSVSLTGGKVRETQPDGSIKVVEIVAGSVKWHEAERHQTENLIGTNMRGLLIELKPRSA